MRQFVHFYPFNPLHSSGATLRLGTAVAGTELLGPTRVIWFDAKRNSWSSQSPEDSDEVVNPTGGLKRALFPETLFESGRHAVEALAPAWAKHVDDETLPILHTSYLAPVIHRVPIGSGAVVDVYDSVWRAHAVSAARARGPLSLTRATYALRARREESRALKHARALVFAGWGDHERARNLGLPSIWCPIGLSTVPTSTRPRSRPLRVGFLGNFAHRATVDSATALLSSPAAQSDAIEIVFGGWHSNECAFLRNAEVHGPVAHPGEFWSQIDVAAIPVISGAGIKCKIIEALLAGIGVVTTPLGADGFDPPTRREMAVVQSLRQLDLEACFSAAPVPQDRLHHLRLDAAAKRYSEFIGGLVSSTTNG